MHIVFFVAILKQQISQQTFNLINKKYKKYKDSTLNKHIIKKT